MRDKLAPHLNEFVLCKGWIEDWKSVDENIKSKEDMYDSIKDNNIVKDIEDIFDAKIDKDNISKL